MVETYHPMTVADPPPTYRARLQLEGGTLAVLGGLASALLLAADGGADDGPASTVGQLVLVAVLIGVFGPRGIRAAIGGAEALDGPADAGSGEPTPLWHLPLILAALATPLLLLGAPDAALRVTGGCTLVGLAQAVVLAGMVGRAERRSGRVFVRRPGSRILRGTVLGWWPA